MSWRDGGFSYPSLRDRSNVLSICALSHMILSKDQNIQTMTRAFIESERQFSRIPIETDITPQFFIWKNIKGESGIASIISTARKAVKNLDVKLRFEAEGLTIRQYDLKVNSNHRQILAGF